MAHEISSYLADIKQSIEEINSFLPDRKDFLEFQRDIKTKRAIERNIEIIGEALCRIFKIDSKFPIIHALKIVDTRNRISHGYDSVSDDIIRAIVIREIPKLETEIKHLYQ